jgi:hypothetical protein
LNRFAHCPLADEDAERVAVFVIPSGARNLSEGYAHEKNEKFLAPLGMTKSWRDFFCNL